VSSEKFDWYATGDNQEIVFPSVQAVAVYRNPAGDVVIRQQGELHEEDSFIIIPAGQVDKVISAMKTAAALAE
jgi:hypothetical protein